METVKRLNAEGKRYYDMQRESNEARSAAWWNNIANGVWTTPPPRDRLGGIARMMGLTERRVREMIAEEWYDVRPGDGISERVRHLADALDSLTDADTALIEQIIHRLRRDDEASSETCSTTPGDSRP